MKKIIKKTVRKIERTVSRKLLAIYRKTNFFVEDLEGKMVRFTAESAHRFPFLKTKKFAVITAWNPKGEVTPLSVNRVQNRKLENELKKGGYHFYKTKGYWRGHSEESFTVERISCAKARLIGKKYRQMAILWNDAKGVRFMKC
jgi:hypothetical protein